MLLFTLYLTYFHYVLTISATLWGIINWADSENEFAGETRLISINNITANITLETNVNGFNFSIDYNLGCYDIINNLYGAIFVDLNDGTAHIGGYLLNNNYKFVTTKIPFNGTYNYNYNTSFLCVGDTNNGILYFMGSDTLNGRNELFYKAQYDSNINQFNITLIQTYLDVNDYSTYTYNPNWRIFDGKRNRIWYKMTANRYSQNDSECIYKYVDINNGNILNTTSCPKNTTMSELAIYYSNIDKIIILKMKDHFEYETTLIMEYLNATTLNIIDTIKMDNLTVCSMDITHAFDHKNGVLYFVGYSYNLWGFCSDGYLYAVNVNTAKFITQNPPFLCTRYTPNDPFSLQWTN